MITMSSDKWRILNVYPLSKIVFANENVHRSRGSYEFAFGCLMSSVLFTIGLAVFYISDVSILEAKVPKTQCCSQKSKQEHKT